MPGAMVGVAQKHAVSRGWHPVDSSTAREHTRCKLSCELWIN